MGDGDIVVDEMHPEITAAVEKAVSDALVKPLNLPASDYISVLNDEIKRVQDERQKKDPTASRYYC